MKPSVMMSIKPKYCELIAKGEKTIEVRKTRPNLQPPFRCYIYCTLPKERFSIGQGNYACSDNLYLCNNKIKFGDGFEDIGKETISFNGKIIGEFVCDEIQEIEADHLVALYFNNPSNVTCITDLELRRYANGKDLFLWHISNLVIYDEPKELREFGQECNIDCPSVRCPYWKYQRVNADEWDYDCSCNNIKPLKRPPQSWCYVEV